MLEAVLGRPGAGLADEGRVDRVAEPARHADPGCRLRHRQHSARAEAARIFGPACARNIRLRACARLNAEGIHARRGKLPRIDFPDRQFDIVIASQVLEHVIRRGLFASEIRRVLEPEWPGVHLRSRQLPGADRRAGTRDRLHARIAARLSGQAFCGRPRRTHARRESRISHPVCTGPAVRPVGLTRVRGRASKRGRRP